MPLYHDATEKIRDNLCLIRDGEKAPLIEIGYFTENQFKEINDSRKLLHLPPLEQNEIVFIGKHLYNRRTEDGYTIDDMVDQILSCLSEASVVDVAKGWSRIDNVIPRADRYGNYVKDRGVFEMTARKPRAELFSVMPKDDYLKPK